MRRLATPILTIVLAVITAVPASAQLRVVNDDPPKWFASAWSGMVFGGSVADDASNSIWGFDTNWMLRGTLEREFPNRLAVGIAFNYARLPLRYSGAGAGQCNGCAADATTASYGALVRWGGGQSFHQIVEFFLGAMRYSSFEQVSPRQKLEPVSGNTDFAFSIGYGWGYSFAEDWQVILMQEYLSTLHERSLQFPGHGRLTQHHTTRLGLRVGF